MNDLSLFLSLGKKIGATDKKVIIKANELKCLLAVRAGSATVTALRLTDTATVILCLDLAGKILSRPVDKTEAIKLSGLKKVGYGTALKTLEIVLDVSTKTSMRDIAVQFGCLDCLNSAVQILTRYESEQCCDIDTNTTLFQTAALLCMCKRQKVRLEVSRLRELSGVKRSTMDRLVAQMDKIAEKLEEEDAKQRTKKKIQKRSLMVDIEKTVYESVEDMSPSKKTKAEKDINYYKNVNFAEWKQKLLERAASETG